MKNNFTPGAWFVDGFDLTSVIVETTPRTFKHIVKCNYGYGDPLTYLDENKANARLIAAAPKMLDALEEAVSTIETLMCEHNDNSLSFKISLSSIKKAIKKATE
jgi:hypothetical protein